MKGTIVSLQWWWERYSSGKKMYVSKVHLTIGNGAICGATMNSTSHHWTFVQSVGGSPLSATCGKCKRLKGMKRKLELYRAYRDAEFGAIEAHE